MMDDYIPKKRFTADKKQNSNIGLTGRLTTTRIDYCSGRQLSAPRQLRVTKKKIKNITRWTISYFTDTFGLRGLFRLTKKTLEFNKPGKQIFLFPPHGNHIAAALRDSRKEVAFASAQIPTLITILLLLTINVSAQIQEPKSPTMKKEYQPVSPNKSYSTTPQKSQRQNSQTRNNNQYRSAIQPKKADEMTTNYKRPDHIYYRLNQNNYSLTSNSNIPNKSYNSVQLVHNILDEVNNYEAPVNYQFPSLQSMPGTNNFNKAYKELVVMLEGRKPLDLKRAVFITENAFFGNKMDYQDYVNSIKEMTLLIQMKMQQEGLPMTNQAINYMTHQYISDTLEIDLPGQEQTATTYPKSYDFEDPFGHEEVPNMFVSKLMAENSGQCKSLPLLFLILVEELGGKAYLSFSPSHSFIKTKDKNGTWYNIELTNGMLTSDSWVVGSGYVKSEAIKSGIFLDTLNKKEVITQCLVDLAQYYGWRYNAYDNFMLKCVNKAMEYDPTNIWAIQVKSDYYTMLFQYVRQQLGYTKPEQLKNNRQALELFMQRNRIYALIDGLGYEPMPEDAYLDWLNTLKEKQQQQEHKKQYFQFSKIVR